VAYFGRRYDFDGRGLGSAVAAVALGADIYERHFVLGDDEDAIDRPVSSTPEEMANQWADYLTKAQQKFLAKK